jgi:hypothetical protein
MGGKGEKTKFISLSFTEIEGKYYKKVDAKK